MRHEMESYREWDAPVSHRPRTSSSSGSKPTVGDLIVEFTRLNMSMMDRMSQMVADALEPERGRESKGHTRHHRYEQECGESGSHEECGDPCYHDSCHCRCCIGDADFVIYARLGERRIAPILLENPRRREREISLELSEWTSHGGKKAAIKAEVLPEKQFTLEACSEKEILLLVDTSQVTLEPAGTKDPAGKVTPPEAATRLQPPDVDDCKVFYADLRTEGCDIRPLRFALAVLPRDCDPLRIHCHCGCCHD